MDQAVAGRDWSQLPADLIVLVLGALEVPDLLRSAAVCRSWRAAYKLEPRLDGASRLFRGPCLLYSSADRDADVATLHSLSESESADDDHTTSTRRRRHHVTLPGPPFRGRYVVGSSHGWLVTADEHSELFLVNPVTRAQISLPPVKTMRSLNLRLTRNKALHSYVLHYMDVAAGCRNPNMYELREFYDPDEARFLLHRRVAISTDPSSGSCIVLIIHCFQEQLSFSRIGDAAWTWIHGEEHFCHYQDLFYNDNDGLFYALRGTGEVHTIDFSGSSAPVVKIIFKEVVNYINNYKYLVRAPWG